MLDSTLLIRVVFQGEPTFSGISTDPSQLYEWPPSPIRLLSALIAGAAANPDFEAIKPHLRTLECLPNPIIIAGRQLEARDPLHFAPKVSDYPTASWKINRNGVLVRPTANRQMTAYENSLRMGVWPGFKGMPEKASVGKYINGERTLTSSEVTFIIPLNGKVADPLEFAAAIDKAAAGVPYLGASRDTAILEATLSTIQAADRDGRDIYHPFAGRGPIRGWAPGVVDFQLKRHQLKTSGAGHDIGHPDHLTQQFSYRILRMESERPILVLATSPVPKVNRIADRMSEVRAALAAPPKDLVVKRAHVVPMINHRHTESNGSLLGIAVIPTSDTDVQTGLEQVISTGEKICSSISWVDMETASLNTIQKATIKDGDRNERGKHLEALQPWTILRSAKRWRSLTAARSFSETTYACARLLLDLVATTELASEQIHIQIRPATRSSIEKGRFSELGRPVDLDKSMSSWHVDVEFEHAVGGPLRIGKDIDLGFGLLIPQDILNREGVESSDKQLPSI